MGSPLRARGALYGLAVGDALGMPTQMLSREEIRGRWGSRLPGFEPAPPGHPIAELIYTLVGTSLATQESVPAAFAVLAAVPDDPWRACLLAASPGGDCDTIAAVAGAVAGHAGPSARAVSCPTGRKPASARNPGPEGGTESRPGRWCRSRAPT